MRENPPLKLALILAFSILSVACGPIGGDAEPGISACPILEGKGTWTQPASQGAAVDTGKPLSAAKVLSAQTAQMTTRGGAFTLNLELTDAGGELLFAGLTTQNFTIDPTSLVLRKGEGSSVNTQVSITTEGLDVKSPTAAGLTGVLLFDSSGSTAGTDSERLRVSGGQLFVDAIIAGTQLAVMDFGVSKGLFEGNVVSPCLQESRLLMDFTSDKLALKASIDRVTAAGGTPMYAAIEDALTMAEAANRMGAQRPFIIVFTDGDASDFAQARADRAINRAKVLESAIHTVALVPSTSPEEGSTDDEDDVNLLNLQRLSAETGGISLTADKANQLPDHFNALASASNTGISITPRFGLTFSPSVEAGYYTLTGNVSVTNVNGGSASAPFRLIIDLRRASM
jgi:Mg-chelatase subunit ChlD